MTLSWPILQQASQAEEAWPKVKITKGLASGNCSKIAA